VPIQIRTWLGRLTREVPGWYFWYAPRPRPSEPWHAVPAPPAVRVTEPYSQPGRVDASTPQNLRAACRRRAGWPASRTTQPGALVVIAANLAALVEAVCGVDPGDGDPTRDSGDDRQVKVVVVARPAPLGEGVVDTFIQQ
jgi:hypothetical protein